MGKGWRRLVVAALRWHPSKSRRGCLQSSSRVPAIDFGHEANGRSDDELLTAAWAYLTAEEAFNLHMSLTYYFQNDEVDPGWHCHVGGGDGEPELTIAIEN